MDAPLLLALTAGMLGAVNPCGFAMLPAYLSILVAGPGDARGALGRALTAAAGLTCGYVLVFGAFGLAFAPLAGWLRPRLPWLTVTLGVGLVLLGCWLLAGRRLPAPLPLARAPRLTRTLPSMVLFGAAYALASLTCSIAPFLAIVATSLQAGSTSRGLALFVAYALGMGLVVAEDALGVALLRDRVVARLREVGRWLPRLRRPGAAGRRRLRRLVRLVRGAARRRPTRRVRRPGGGRRGPDPAGPGVGPGRGRPGPCWPPPLLTLALLAARGRTARREPGDPAPAGDVPVSVENPAVSDPA
ncbi:cytochrome c biogenesis protein, transmembrane region [Micromonospora sp. ATCC 39149]|uniref:cytochrome c biogenesis CcdA family protein n=1 Tax=Micromonospora sp. (strain ATCC 39149 / NRRL 15099 / SCC 1413) TaxID=219305 RepID=UPI0001A50E93|nr:cytochrome c biogenesis CcdA family protein [Micromonospora sp. ATCC 39149]EEP71098.1 cytochrome c biogenesis protein, transmembrane region [Micromonospora sp. ATCC 39149]